jgi:hypothetical protein
MQWQREKRAREEGAVSSGVAPPVPMQGVQPRTVDAQTQMVQEACNSLQQVTLQLQKLVVAPALAARPPDALNLNVEKALGGNSIAYTDASPDWAGGLADRRKLL